MQISEQQPKVALFAAAGQMGLSTAGVTLPDLANAIYNQLYG